MARPIRGGTSFPQAYCCYIAAIEMEAKYNEAEVDDSSAGARGAALAAGRKDECIYSSPFYLDNQ